MNLIYFYMISDKWQHRVKRNKLPTLHTATKQPFLLKGLLLPHPRLGNVHTQIWFGIAANPARDTLLRTFIKSRLYVVNSPANETSYPGTLNQSTYLAEM